MQNKILCPISWISFFTVYFGFLISGALANGAPYAPGAMGGIEFKYNKDISIESETLFVSPDLIHVSYIFNSTSNREQIIDIAFPITSDSVEAGGTRPDESYSNNFLEVIYDGKTIHPEKHVLVDNVDVTDWLEIYKDEDGIVTLTNRIKDPVAAKIFFDKNNIAFHCDDNNNCRLNEGFDEVYLWQQKFKPGLNAIEVKYKPSIGGDYYFSVKDEPPSYVGDVPYTIDREMSPGFGYLPTDSRNSNPTYRQYFCIDDETDAAMKRIMNKDKEKSYSGYGIVYIWDTARYWNGPIKKFHLIIEKSSPQQIVSYCPYVGQKTSPTRFEWETENFVPQGILRVFYFPDLGE